MAVLQKPTEPQQSEYLALECGRSMAEGVPVSTLLAWLRTCYGGAERTAEAAPAEIERYFVECERLRDQGASADQLHALSHSYGVGDGPLSHAVERVYMSPVDTRRDGVVVLER
jgi:hypothetical protein